MLELFLALLQMRLDFTSLVEVEIENPPHLAETAAVYVLLIFLKALFDIQNDIVFRFVFAEFSFGLVNFDDQGLEVRDAFLQ